MDAISLLAWKDAVAIQNISLSADQISLNLFTTAPMAHCPQCGLPSDNIHSRYERKVADLPWAGMYVNIVLKVRRFFCDSKDCNQKTFAERLQTVPRYGRRTQRMQHQLTQLAGQLGGRPGAKLASLLGMSVSFRTLPGGGHLDCFLN